MWSLLTRYLVTEIRLTSIQLTIDGYHRKSIRGRNRRQYGHDSPLPHTTSCSSTQIRPLQGATQIPTKSSCGRVFYHPYRSTSGLNFSVDRKRKWIASGRQLLSWALSSFCWQQLSQSCQLSLSALIDLALKLVVNTVADPVRLTTDCSTLAAMAYLGFLRRRHIVLGKLHNLCSPGFLHDTQHVTSDWLQRVDVTLQIQTHVTLYQWNKLMCLLCRNHWFDYHYTWTNVLTHYVYVSQRVSRIEPRFPLGCSLFIHQSGWCVR